MANGNGSHGAVNTRVGDLGTFQWLSALPTDAPPCILAVWAVLADAPNGPHHTGLVSPVTHQSAARAGLSVGAYVWVIETLERAGVLRRFDVPGGVAFLPISIVG